MVGNLFAFLITHIIESSFPCIMQILMTPVHSLSCFTILLLLCDDRYAREDTHYLLYIYDLMRGLLHSLPKEAENSDTPLVEVQ